MTNTNTIRFTDGREILLSYGVPVAAFVPPGVAFTMTDGQYAGSGYVKTARKFSVTTSRHANGYAGQSAPAIPDDVFIRLIAPLEAKR